MSDPRNATRARPSTSPVTRRVQGYVPTPTECDVAYRMRATHAAYSHIGVALGVTAATVCRWVQAGTEVDDVIPDDRYAPFADAIARGEAHAYMRLTARAELSNPIWLLRVMHGVRDPDRDPPARTEGDAQPRGLTDEAVNEIKRRFLGIE